MEGHEHGIECLTESLVREYLARKGFTTSLNILDEELGREKNCITNRAHLINELHLQKLVKKNRIDPQNSFRTLFELIIKDFLKSSKKKKHSHLHDSSQDIGKDSPDRVLQGDATFTLDKITSNSLKQINGASSHSFHVPKSHSLELKKKGRPQKIRLNKDSELSLSVNGSKIKSHCDLYTNKKNREFSMSSPSKEPIKSLLLTQPKIVRKNIYKNDEVPSDVELYDISDEDLADGVNCQAPRITNLYDNINVEYITTETIKDLRKLMFGKEDLMFGPEWTDQNFEFSKINSITYGLVQKKGGPCGLLAAVQAYVLKSLLYGSMDGTCEGNYLRPTTEACNNALLEALALILWKIGQEKHAIIVQPSNKIVCDYIFPKDGFIEYLTLNHFTKYGDLISFMKNSYTYHLKNKNCCIGFLYSAILTRGIKNVKQDMDDPSLFLIGNHSYCTQEMVNLLLVGKAISNVFDGQIEIPGEGKYPIILKGPTSTSEIGFLSLFDHSETIKVGDYLKNPIYPIWLVLRDSHFTVIFLTTDHPKDTPVFNVFYYDMIANQEEEIKLTLTLNSFDNEAVPDVNTPSLEHCIRTKWPTAQISWNNTEPLL